MDGGERLGISRNRTYEGEKWVDKRIKDKIDNRQTNRRYNTF